MKTIILPNGQLYSIRFDDNILYGSLTPIKTGGRQDYFCRDCFQETHDKELSCIQKGTPHWTQSLYPDGVTTNEARITTRVCDKHAMDLLTNMISDDIAQQYEQDKIFLARVLVYSRKHIRLYEIEELLKELTNETTES
jgi:hypothetical protein